MAATSRIASFGAMNTKAALATMSIAGFDLGPHSRVQKVRLESGEAPSMAQGIVPLKVLNDIAPSISAVAGSPLSKIFHGQPAEVLAQINPDAGTSDPLVSVFKGYISDINADIGKDCGIVLISDARWLIEGISLLGSFWAQPDGSVQFREGVRAHFNKNKAPNMIWATQGGITAPVFCDEYFGINDTVETSGSSIPFVTTGSQSLAQKWTSSTMLQYFQFATSATATALVTPYFPFYKGMPDTIVFQDNLSSVFADGTEAPEREAPEKVIHCHSLMNAITEVCRGAGPYAPYILDSGTNAVIQIVRSQYNGMDQQNVISPSASKGISLARAGVNGVTLATGGCITKGFWNESSRSTYSIFAVTGARAMIEARFNSSSTEQNPVAANASMWWAWTVAYSNEAKQSLLDDAHGNISGSETAAILNMLKKYPDLFAVWFINPLTDFQAGTTQAGLPIAKNTRPPLPHLLTSYVKSGTADQFAKINSRRPIPVETSLDAGTTWVTIQENDGLIIEPNGHISLKAFRDSSNGALIGKTYKIVSTGAYGSGGYAITTFEPLAVRMNLAVPCDQRITGSIKMSWDHTPDSADKLPLCNGQTNDGDRMDPSFSRLLAIDAGTLYGYEERGGTLKSYPLPASLKDPTTNAAYPASDSTAGQALYGAANVIMNDQRQADNHAFRSAQENGRLKRGGKLITPHIVLTAQPGQMVSDLGGFAMPSVHRAVELDFQMQTSVRELQ